MVNKFIAVELEWMNDYTQQFPACVITYPRPGGRLNKKDGLTRYGDSHVKDKTS